MVKGRLIIGIFSLVIVYLIFIDCNRQSGQVKSTSLSDSTKGFTLISRAEWGSSDTLIEKQTHTITKITIHHGGVEFKPEKSPPEYLKNLQKWSRSEKDWIDIPYHYLMDLNGVIYEGGKSHYPGDTNTDYDPTGHLLICLLGNYEIQEPGEEQITSLVNFIAYYCTELGINVNQVKSHKDYTETDCPGKNLYIYLKNGELIKRVKSRIEIIKRH